MLTFFKPQMHLIFWHGLKTQCSRLRIGARNDLFGNLAFEPVIERQFWECQHKENLANLLSSLMLGVAAFFVLFGLDVLTREASLLKQACHLLVMFSLSGAVIYLRIKDDADKRVPGIVKTSILLSILVVTGILVVDVNPADYMASWLGLLLIGFVSYGQISISGIETRLLNLMAVFALLLIGNMIGVEVLMLAWSVLLLLIFNLFGACAQYRLEVQARRLFIERRKASSVAEDRTLFLRQISHNLRQPLQAVSCYSSVLEAGFADKASDPMCAIIGKLGVAIDELNNAFTHILDIANLETGKQIPLLTEVDLNVLLARMEDQFAPQASRRGLKLVVKQRSRPPYNIYSDACILSQIIGNLIDNAIKYTAKGWILVETVNIGNQRLKLHVIDTGIGIAEPQKSKIFDEFFRCNRHSQELHAQGLGIGLAYVAKAVGHLPKHALKVYSKLDQGSDFQLLLPVADVAPRCEWSAHAIDNSELAGTFVFLVDDDPEVLDALAERLRGWGCLVQKAASRDQIITALRENIRAPDLLISDFYLDNQETAHDIIKLIEAEYGNLPTLILSAHVLSADINRRLPAHARVLRKPAGADMLLDAIHQVLAQADQKKPLYDV